MTKTLLSFSFSLVFISVLLTKLNAQIPQDGLIGYYKFDGNTDDSSASSNDGNSIGVLSYTEDRLGSENGALWLQGGFIDLGRPDEYETITAISIAVWVNTTKIDDWQAIFTKWEGFEEGGFYLGLNPEGNVIRWNMDVPNPIDADTVSINEWYHIVATYDGDTSNLYMNGVLVKQEFHNLPLRVNDANVMIGVQADNIEEGLFEGAMDDLLVYNRAIDEDEVIDIFNFMTTSSEQLTESKMEFTLYPNPAENVVLVKAGNLLEGAPYTIIDVHGKMMSKGIVDKSTIDISWFKSGVYFILIEQNEKVLQKKFIVR